MNKINNKRQLSQLTVLSQCWLGIRPGNVGSVPASWRSHWTVFFWFAVDAEYEGCPTEEKYCRRYADTTRQRGQFCSQVHAMVEWDRGLESFSCHFTHRGRLPRENSVAARENARPVGLSCTCYLLTLIVARYSGAVYGPGFKSQPRRCRVTVLGKLFTPIVPLFTKQQNW